jgi:hypothetical protein
MFQRISRPFSMRVVFYAAILISLIACTPAAAPEAQPIEPVTPTPEIFSALAPSPTPPDSSLPLTCQVTDLSVYVNAEWGYCFAYPGTFTVDESRIAEGILTLYGPALEDNADPLRVSLEIAVQPVPEGSALAPLVDAFLSTFDTLDMPWTITREPWLLGSTPAEKVEPIPGLLSSRVVMAQHEEQLFMLRFHPSDMDIAKPGLDDLTQTVSGSFAFLPETTSPASRPATVSWSEFGRDISLSYTMTLAPWVQARTVPEVPVSDQVLFAASQPTYTQFRFLGFQGGRPYDLPIMPPEDRVPQIRVFRTADFPRFGMDSSQGFVSQLAALEDLLERGVEPERCAQITTGEPAMPFLPWINMQQVFCAQPQQIEFAGGAGIRYLSYYSQGLNPVLDQQIFYTFQGVTDDGQFYVSALFPVQTGIFPTELPDCQACSEPGYDPSSEWRATLTDQIDQLNALPEDKFAPSLPVLDALIESIQIRQ